MILFGIVFLLFVNTVICLQCKTSWPPNCLYNSTCNYRTKECEIISSTSNNRGGIYCTTIIKKEGDDFFIGTMDCMYDQETTKTCRNQSECSLKYTNDQKQFLHCCCDQQFCNLNFTLSDPYPLSTSTIHPYPCQHFLCKSLSIIIIIITIFIIVVILIVIAFLYRKKFRRSLRKCRGLIEKSPPVKINDNSEKGAFLPIEDNSNNQQISYKDLFIGNLLKRGRFSTIYQGLFNNHEVAIKTLISNNLNDQSRALFEHEKNIYSLPYMNHFNILQYYGYSNSEDKFCLITALSKNGSLKDVLRSRLLNDENELLLIIKQISEGLHYLHTDYRNKNGLTRPPIAHRDLKTENILFINSNQLVICDFAMSTVIQLNQNGLNQEQQIGTARYMSPEILAGTIGCEETALLKCDVYALGIIFWEILSRFPFENENLKYIQPFEEQLIKKNLNVNNPTVNDMYEITHLSEPYNRPLINQLWIDSNSRIINSIILLIKECWEQTPETRISSGVVCNRINQLTK